MKFIRNAIFTNPQQVQDTFYQAFAAQDINLLMSVWAEDDEILCIFPTGLLLEGYNAIRQEWAMMLGKKSDRLTIRVNERLQLDGTMHSIRHNIEEIAIHDNKGKTTESGFVLTTHVINRTPDGWRLVMHHSTGVSPSAAKQYLEMTNDTAHEPSPAKRTLH
jgi:ketosteroid isomerase-like protein